MNVALSAAIRLAVFIQDYPLYSVKKVRRVIILHSMQLHVSTIKM